MDVHLRDLRYFLVVADELHFTRAAERLFISQPALSKQIRHLEGQLRVRLFTRDRRSVALTAAGQALVVVASELLAAWDAGQHRVSQAAADAAAVLRVGIATGLGRGLLSAVGDALAERHPSWRLQVRQIPWTDPTGGLADGTIGEATTDLAILWLPVPEAERLGLRWRVLTTEPRHLALPAAHPLARADRLAFGDLLDEPFVALPGEAGVLRDYWLATDHRDGRPARIGAEAASADEAFEAIGSGVGVALIAAGNAELYRHPGVVTRPVVGVSPCQLAVVWREVDARLVVRDSVEAAVAHSRGGRCGQGGRGAGDQGLRRQRARAPRRR